MMSDDAFGLAMALTCIALVLVLYHRWQAGRALKRLIKSLERDGIKIEDLLKDSPSESTDRDPAPDTSSSPSQTPRRD